MLRKRGMAKSPRANDAAKIAFDERNAAAFDGDVGAGTHGDADVRLSERGSVIDSVTRHGDNSSLFLKLFHDGVFAFRRDLRGVLSDAQLLGDGFRGIGIVPGQHHHVQTFVAQHAHRFRSAGLNGIGDSEQAREFSVDHDEDDRLPLAL